MRHRELIFIALVGLPTLAQALSTDAQQPIRIEADSVLIDEARGVSVYRGNVRYSQGSTQLSAEEVTLHSADRKHVDKVMATGAPATFRQRPDNQDQDVRGQARHIEYQAEGGRLLLQDEAHLWHIGNEFAGNRIEYDTRAETVKAQRDESGAERVQVIIQPRRESDVAAPPAMPDSTP